MASLGLIDNFCKRINGTEKRIGGMGQGMGLESFRALAVYLGHNPDIDKPESDHALLVDLYTRIAGLVLGPVDPPRDIIIKHYWEGKVAREQRNKIFDNNIKELCIADEKKPLKRNLTSVVGVLADKLTQGGYEDNMSEAVIKETLKRILEEVWHKTYGEQLILPNPISQE